MPNFRSGMDATIALNYQARFIAVEANNVLSKLMLSSKLETEQLTVAQSVPKK